MRTRLLLSVMLILLVGAPPLLAQTAAAPPDPAPDPAAPNIFYGSTLPGSERQPVLVFVHGLHGTASDWWGANSMYALAWAARYRTAFVSLSPDNTPNDAGIDANAAVLRQALPMISTHFGGEKMYLIGHSKGGIDIQGALLYPAIPHLVEGVFTISTPNQGTELADWAFGPGIGVAQNLGLLTPGVFALQTSRMASFRALADPILRATGIPFYTMTGDLITGNPITEVTGIILKQLVPGQFSDGLVPVGRSLLPDEYSNEVGRLHANHFVTDNGVISFSRIHSIVQGLQTTMSQFKQVARAGLGDPHNTWIWSMKWFKGQLYVGTGREAHCVSLATANMLQDVKFYELGYLAGDCPDFTTFERSLAAEIWRYTPATEEWHRVYKAPETVPVGKDADGFPILIGRDIGYRGMESFIEADGTEALYAGGASAGEMFGEIPPYNVIGFPPPRLLRSVDGVNWTPVPQATGTFLGEIARPRPGSTREQWSFRGLTSYKGLLFATVSDYRGVGMLVASATPAAGNNAWFAASPIPEQFPIWNVTTFNNFLYVTTGDQALPDNPGTGLYKTNAVGPPPYQFQPVIVNGGEQTIKKLQSPDGLSFMEFKGQLYLGTNRPTELYRINPDDTWDLIVGEARMTSTGLKTPLSGFGIGFGSWFNGHFWRMGTLGDQLFLSTWDWSIQLRGIGDFDHIFDDQYGFDLLRTTDGIHWTAVSRNGMGDPENYGGRSIEATPYGLFIGTARLTGGGQVFQCLTPTCADTPKAVAAPADVESVSGYVSDAQAIVSWQPVPGAVRYHVYRAVIHPISYYLQNQQNLSIAIPGLPQPITFEAIQSGQFDAMCTGSATNTLCEAVDMVKDAAALEGFASFPQAFSEVAVTFNTMFTEPAASTRGALYYVRAEDQSGNLSDQSNFVLAPSKALPGPPPTITATLSPSPNALRWNRGPVTVTWEVTSATGLLSPPCAPVTLTGDTDGTLVSCTAVSGNGMPATKVTLVRIDSVAPQITATRTPPPNQFGWNNTAVEVHFSCTDDRSGILGCGPDTQVVDTEGAGQFRVGVAVDQAGNSANLPVGPINIDFTPPQVIGSRAPAANAFGWNNTPVAVTFTCADALSHVRQCQPATQVVSGEGVGQFRSAAAIDFAGNVATATVGDINLDLTPPVITASQLPAANANGWNNTTVTVSFTATDALSGMATVSPPAVLGSEGGGQLVVGIATDRAGNTSSLQRSINVDLTAPEAIVRFDPPTRAPIVLGSDALSGAAARVTQLPRERGANTQAFLIRDLADNTLEIALSMQHHRYDDDDDEDSWYERRVSQELHTHIARLRYNGGAVLPVARNELKFEWSQRKDGALKELEQGMRLKGRPPLRMRALFDAKKNLTVLRMSDAWRREADERRRNGLVLLRMTTSKGTLAIDFD